MHKADIDLRRCVSVDLETALIRPALCAPPIVCLTTARLGDETGRLFPTADVESELRRLLADESVIIVGHNVAYDFACILEWLPALRTLVFAAYEADRIGDSMLCQRLIEIETGDLRGKLSLDMLCARYGLKHETKGAIDPETGEPVRLSYGRYLGAPLEAYPPEFISYACDDALLTLKLFERMLSRGLVARADLAMMARDDLALKLVAAEGLMCDGERVVLLEAAASERRDDLQAELLEPGLLRMKREKGADKITKTMGAVRERVAEAFAIPIRIEQKTPKHQPQVVYDGPEDEVRTLTDRGLLTETGNIATGRLVLEESGDPILMALAEYGEWNAVWNKDLPAFRFSAERGVPLHTRFGFAATTRTTSGGGVGGIRFNQQNQRRTEGIRECFRAPDGGAYVATDYTGLENATLAQVIAWTLGRKGPAEKYSSGFDDHSDVGRHMVRGIDQTGYDEFIAMLAAPETKKGCSEYRKAAKPLNFGLPGYMTRPETVASYARIGYGVSRPVEFWASMIALWYETQHDKVAYLKEYVDGLRNPDGRYSVPIPSTGIVRRGATRTAAGNTPFQGLGARVALAGLYLVVRDQMLGKMRGRACAFIHDEIISHTRGAAGAHPDDVQHLREQQESRMIAAAERVMPDIKMRVESVAMRHWSKDAAHAEDDFGRLVVSADDYHVKTKGQKK